MRFEAFPFARGSSLISYCRLSLYRLVMIDDFEILLFICFILEMFEVSFVLGVSGPYLRVLAMDFPYYEWIGGFNKKTNAR